MDAVHKTNGMSGKDPKVSDKRYQFRDRRSGEDRRMLHSLEYFSDGGIDRRAGLERRENKERRTNCVRVSEWSSACPDYEDEEYLERRIKL